MARITVEDCLENVDNRFQLVLIATKRARQIEQGKQPLLDLENDKPTVVALREIAAGLVDSSILKEQEREPEPEAFESEIDTTALAMDMDMDDNDSDVTRESGENSEEAQDEGDSLPGPQEGGEEAD